MLGLFVVTVDGGSRLINDLDASLCTRMQLKHLNIIVTFKLIYSIWIILIVLFLKEGKFFAHFLDGLLILINDLLIFIFVLWYTGKLFRRIF